MSETLSVTVTFLEQTARPVFKAVPRPSGKIALLHVENPPVHFYRYLYKIIGERYNWVTRTLLNDSDLRAIITHPKVYIYVLYINGSPGGLAEIDARNARSPEIKFFGLTPDFVGKGYGRFFMSHVVDLAWTCSTPPAQLQNVPNKTSIEPANSSSGPERVLIETCTLDHPAALPLYQKFGFSVIDRREGSVPKLNPDTL